MLSPSNTVMASGSFSAGRRAIAIGFPSPPAPAGEVATVTLSAGTPAPGDTFTLTPGGTGSNGNGTAMAGLASQNLLSGQTLGDAYAALVTRSATRPGSAGGGAAAQAVLTQAQPTQQSLSGVNLDEEAAHLVAYQQAYQASAQVIATTQTLFQALLTAVQAWRWRLRISTSEFLLGALPTCWRSKERQPAQPRGRHRSDDARRHQRSGGGGQASGWPTRLAS